MSFDVLFLPSASPYLSWGSRLDSSSSSILPLLCWCQSIGCFNPTILLSPQLENFCLFSLSEIYGELGIFEPSFQQTFGLLVRSKRFSNFMEFCFQDIISVFRRYDFGHQIYSTMAAIEDLSNF